MQRSRRVLAETFKPDNVQARGPDVKSADNARDSRARQTKVPLPSDIAEKSCDSPIAMIASIEKLSLSRLKHSFRL